MTALLIGRPPLIDLGHSYVTAPPYDGVVIGSLELGELVCFHNQAVLQALATGLPVILYTPGLPGAPQNRALAAALSARQRELKSWGVVFTDGGQKRLITAQEAKTMRARGVQPAPGAVLTPLAKEILEGSK